jgi:integrase
MDARKPEKAEGAILRNTFGEKWTTDGFKTSWGKAFGRAGLDEEDLHFHDLRGTAVTRLALVGCTVPEIAPSRVILSGTSKLSSKPTISAARSNWRNRPS